MSEKLKIELVLTENQKRVLLNALTRERQFAHDAQGRSRANDDTDRVIEYGRDFADANDVFLAVCKAENTAIREMAISEAAGQGRLLYSAKRVKQIPLVQGHAALHRAGYECVSQVTHKDNEVVEHWVKQGTNLRAIIRWTTGGEGETFLGSARYVCFHMDGPPEHGHLVAHPVR